MGQDNRAVGLHALVGSNPTPGAWRNPHWLRSSRQVELTPARVAIRPLRVGDFESLREIERAGMDEYLRYLIETGEKDTVTLALEPAYFEHHLSMGTSFVAETDAKIVGYILSQPASFVQNGRKELWLEYIIVVSQYRRKGIGSMLLTEVADWAEKHEIELLYTNLNPNNPESAHLLEKHGFTVRNWTVAHRTLR